MLIWINGPFGGGKTHTAHELHRRLPGSIVCDPEEVGFGLHRMLPRPLRADFQDLASWRAGVVEVLDRAARGHDGPILVPMTVVDDQYFAETVGRLRELGHPLLHVSLLARRETVLRRLRERGLGMALRGLTGNGWVSRVESFAVQNLDRCLDQLQRPEFATQIWTDDVALPAVADRIGELAGLTLRPNTDSAPRAALRRAAVGLRHVRVL